MNSASDGKLVAQLARRPLARAAAWLRRDRAMILMLHRFADPVRGNRGHNASSLRNALALFRSAGIQFVSLDELVTQLRSNPTARWEGPARCAFTLDDGYADAFEIAAPVFHEFDCPFTVYVVPQIIDRRSWFWWDQISFIFSNTRRTALHANIGPANLSVLWGSEDERRHAAFLATEAVKRIPIGGVSHAIEKLALMLDVEVPTACPERFRLATWDELRSAERNLATIGAHTMTHPILSNCTDEQAEHEIVASMQRVREELRRPSRVFCYPNGSTADFGTRETEILARTGALGAVSTLVGTIKLSPVPRTPDWFFRIPRIPFDSRKGAAIRSLLVAPR